MSNIIVQFPTSGPGYTEDGWQYDYGRVLELRGLTGLPAAPEVHFAADNSLTTETRIGTVIDNILTCPIPDTIMQSQRWTAYVYTVTETSGSTMNKAVVTMSVRPEPSDVITPEQKTVVDDLVAKLNAVDVNEPIIGENGNWWIYNKTTGEYEDSGEPSQGVIGLTGPQGKSLLYTWDGTQLGVKVEGDADYVYVDLKGATGATGNGIASVARTSGTGAPGTTDTYTITFTSGATSTFTVTHGTNGTATSVLTGYSVAAVNAPIAASDTVLQAFGKAQKQLNDTSSAISELSDLAGNGELDTSAQDLTGALNELVGATVAAVGIDDDQKSAVLTWSSDKVSDIVDHIISVETYGAKGDGATDDTAAIQSAIDAAYVLGGGSVCFGNKIYRCCGLAPKDNVTLLGTGASTLKLIDAPTDHLISYNSTTTITNFNLRELILDGNSQIVYDIIHIEKPNPEVSVWYVWDASIVDSCIIQKGGVGIYCSTPGAIRITNCKLELNDIGIACVNEHFYVTNTTFWHNRIAANVYKMNHATWLCAVIAHSSEAGVVFRDTAEGSGAAVANTLIGCNFIDNACDVKGLVSYSRFDGCRFTDSAIGIQNLYYGNVVANCLFSNKSDCGIKLNPNVVSATANGVSNTVEGCMFYNNTVDIYNDGDETNILNNQFFTTQQMSVTLGTRAIMGLNIQGNNFLNQSTAGEAQYSCVFINQILTASIISNNVFRNGTTGLASYGITFQGDKPATDVLVIGNVARGMKTGGYLLRSSVTQANNIGTVATV